MSISVVVEVDKAMSIISYVVDVVLYLLWQIGHIISRQISTRKMILFYLKRVKHHYCLMVRNGSKSSSNLLMRRLVLIMLKESLKEKRQNRNYLMKQLQIKLEENFLIHLFKESKQNYQRFKFRKPMKKLHKLRKSLNKPRRRTRKKCNKQLARRKIRLSRFKSRSRKDRRRSKNTK